MKKVGKFVNLTKKTELKSFKNMFQLPKKAKKVFQGEIFQVWQWSQKMYDGSVQTFERLDRADTTQVIATSGNKVLIQKQQQPDKEKIYTSLPGGRVEEQEDALKSAKRELLEETGLISEDWELWQKYSPVGKVVYCHYIFIARNCQKVADQNLDGGEKIENRWVDFVEFLDLTEDDSFFDLYLKNYFYKCKLDSKIKTEFKKLLFKKIVLKLG